MLQLARRMSSYFVSGNYSSIGLTKIRDARAARRRKTRVSADGDQLPLTGLVILLAACVALPLGTIAAYSQSAAVQNSTPSDKDAVLQQTIHDYIIAHPEVIIESLQRAKAKAEEHKAELIKSQIVAFRKNLVEDPNAPVLGNPKGDVTLVEFFDYRCPYCRQVEPWVQSLLKQDPGVRLVEKEFPILGPASVYAAHMALAALKQGKHAAFRNALMAKEGNMAEGNIHEDLVLEVAKSVGLDINRMEVDMKSPDIEGEIQGNMQLGRVLGLTGTPAFIIGTELVPGATDLTTLHEMVDDARHGLNQ